MGLDQLSYQSNQTLVIEGRFVEDVHFLHPLELPGGNTGILFS